MIFSLQGIFTVYNPVSTGDIKLQPIPMVCTTFWFYDWYLCHVCWIFATPPGVKLPDLLTSWDNRASLDLCNSLFCLPNIKNHPRNFFEKYLHHIKWKTVSSQTECPSLVTSQSGQLAMETSILGSPSSSPGIHS